MKDIFTNEISTAFKKAVLITIHSLKISIVPDICDQELNHYKNE